MWNSGSYRWRKGHSGLYLPGGFPVGPTLWPGTDYVGSQIYPSVMNLVAHRNLTINSITQGPDFIYLGSQATTSAWPAYQVGSDLAIAGSGADVSTGQASPFYGSLDGGVKTAYTGKGFIAGSNTIYDITTKDIVFEVVVMMPDASIDVNQYIFGKAVDANYYHSLVLANSSNTTKLQWNLIGGGNGNNVSSIYLSQYTINHFCCFFKFGAYAIIYANGQPGTASDVSSLLTLTNTAQAVFLNLNSIRGLTTPLYYVAMWTGASWLDTHLQADLAKQRSQMLWGMYPKYSKGASLAEVL